MSATSSAPSLKSWLLGVVVPLIVVSAGVFLFLAMGKTTPKQIVQDDSPAARLMRRPIVDVAAGQPFDSDRTLDLDVSGVVVPFRQVTIASEVAGRVTFKSENCRIGRFVEKDELLIKLDATDYQMEVERLTAMRESEYAQQKELDQDVANAQRMLELADQEVTLQEREIARLNQLPNGFVSQTELDQARRVMLNASNQKLTVQNQLETLATRRTRILLSERLAGTQLAMAKVNLARTEVKAPLAGVIVTESVEQASFVQKGANLCVIDDTTRVEVSCNLRADQLLLILDHQDKSFGPGSEGRDQRSESYELPSTPVTVEFRVAGREYNVYTWSGVLSRYEGIGLDAKSRTIPVRIFVEGPRNASINGKLVGENTTGGLPALVQGMFVECHIHTAPKRELTLIPKLALRPGNQLWILQPDSTPLTSEESANEKGSPIGWQGGTLRLLEGVRPIRTLRSPAADGKEFWVVEARNDLSSQSLFVVSPVAGFLGDGSDQVRFQSQ